MVDRWSIVDGRWSILATHVCIIFLVGLIDFGFIFVCFVYFVELYSGVSRRPFLEKSVGTVAIHRTSVHVDSDVC